MLTTQVANQFTAIGVQLFSMLVLSLLGYVVLKVATVVPQYLDQKLAGIKDTRIRSVAQQLVTTAEATISAAGPQKLNDVLAGLKGRFPGTPVDVLLPAVEHEVAQLHMQLGTFTPAKPGEKPAAPPVPVLDQVALRAALNSGLGSLVPASLTSQVEGLIDAAFASAVTTIDKAVSPASPALSPSVVVLAGTHTTADLEAVKRDVLQAPAGQDVSASSTIILPAGVVPTTPGVTEPTPL